MHIKESKRRIYVGSGGDTKSCFRYYDIYNFKENNNYRIKFFPTFLEYIKHVEFVIII